MTLPDPSPAPSKNFKWRTEHGYNDLDGATVCDLISRAYIETKSWRRNIFLVTSCHAGKAFVSELARLFNAVASGSALEGIALKAALTAPSLLLQEPSAKSKAKDHSDCLARRLEMWKGEELSTYSRKGEPFTIAIILRTTSPAPIGRTPASLCGG